MSWQDAHRYNQALREIETELNWTAGAVRALADAHPGLVRALALPDAIDRLDEDASVGAA